MLSKRSYIGCKTGLLALSSSGNYVERVEDWFECMKGQPIPIPLSVQPCGSSSERGSQDRRSGSTPLRRFSGVRTGDQEIFSQFSDARFSDSES